MKAMAAISGMNKKEAGTMGGDLKIFKDKNLDIIENTKKALRKELTPVKEKITIDKIKI